MPTPNYGETPRTSVIIDPNTGLPVTPLFAGGNIGAATGTSLTTTGQVSASTTRSAVTTVAALPAAAANAGAVSMVSDASTTLVLGLGGTVAGGGANFSPVWSDGTNWRYG